MLKRVLRWGSFTAAVGLLLIALRGVGKADGIAVPEIDAGMVSSGVAILTGAALLLVERFRRR